jgi:hypothetical protein
VVDDKRHVSAVTFCIRVRLFVEEQWSSFLTWPFTHHWLFCLADRLTLKANKMMTLVSEEELHHEAANITRPFAED